MQKLLIFTDTDKTQINGVRVSINNLIRCLESSTLVKCISPDDFTSFSMPSYPEIQLSIASPRKIRAIISEFQPDFIHIATE